MPDGFPAGLREGQGLCHLDVAQLPHRRRSPDTSNLRRCAARMPFQDRCNQQTHRAECTTDPRGKVTGR